MTLCQSEKLTAESPKRCTLHALAPSSASHHPRYYHQHLSAFPSSPGRSYNPSSKARAKRRVKRKCRPTIGLRRNGKSSLSFNLQTSTTLNLSSFYPLLNVAAYYSNNWLLDRPQLELARKEDLKYALAQSVPLSECSSPIVSQSDQPELLLATRH